MVGESKVICLCGSTRFTSEMLFIQWRLSKQGNVVLGWNALPDWYYIGEDKTHIADQEGEEVKRVIDETHLRKIDLSDEVLVLNIDGYVGESTTNEILYALKMGKLVKFLEPGWDYPFLKEEK